MTSRHHRRRRLVAGALRHLHEVRQEDRHADRRDQRRQAERAAQRPVGDALDRPRPQATVSAMPATSTMQQRQRQTEAMPSSVRQRQEDDQRDEGRQHEHVAMGEVHHADDAEHHRVADGDEAVDRAQREAVDELLDEVGIEARPGDEIHQESVHARGWPRRPHSRARWERSILLIMHRSRRSCQRRSAADILSPRPGLGAASKQVLRRGNGSDRGSASAEDIVSYRRSNSSATAGRIYDHLLSHFGEGAVFMDVDAIPFGTDFRTHIRFRAPLERSRPAVIGPRWLGPNADGTRRIDDKADPVRVEVETAMRHGITIVPVLIDGTPMPGAGQLPEALRDLAFLNAAPVDMGRDFRAHMDRLSRSASDGILAAKHGHARRRHALGSEPIGLRHQPADQGGAPKPVAQDRLSSQPNRNLRTAAFASVFVAALVGAAGWWTWGGKSAAHPAQAAKVGEASAERRAAASAAAGLSVATPPLGRRATSEPGGPSARGRRAASETDRSGSRDRADGARSTDRAGEHASGRDPNQGTWQFRLVRALDHQRGRRPEFLPQRDRLGRPHLGLGDAAYTMLLAGPVPVAGLATLPAVTVAQGARPSWVGYVSVSDVDASVAQAKELGATVYRAPTDVAGVGRYALIADPQGASIVLYKGLVDAPPAATPPTAVGYAGWRELQAGDRDGAFDFYARMFGWKKAEAQDVTTPGYQQFSAGAETIGAVMSKPASVPVPYWTYYFQVDGLAAALGRVQSAGGTIVVQPHQVRGGSWVAQGIDPQGAIFALTSARR